MPLSAGTWTVTLTPTSTASAPKDAFACEPLSFTLQVTPTETGVRLLAVLDGPDASRAELASKPGAPNSFEGSLGIPHGDCNASLTVESLELSAFDKDGDGLADLLLGAGAGPARVWHDDYTTPGAFTFEFSGVPDTTPPVLRDTAFFAGPLGGMRLSTSEPLLPGATASLVGTPEIPLTPEVHGDLVTAFSSAVILPFDSTWDVAANGSDLAGLALTSQSHVTSAEDPGVSAQDGFESCLTASCVTAFGDIAALTGERSLHIGNQGSRVFHLVRAPGQNTLQLQVRMLFSEVTEGSAAPGTAGARTYASVSAGTIGGTQRVGASVSVSGNRTATNIPEFPYAGDLQTLSIDLPDEGADVVVVIETGEHPCTSNYFNCRPQPKPPGLLVDELRIE